MSTRAKPWGRVSILHKTRGFLMLYIMCFISRWPLTYRIIINRKELYDFYYTAITLTTEYNEYLHDLFVHMQVHLWRRPPNHSSDCFHKLEDVGNKTRCSLLCSGEIGSSAPRPHECCHGDVRPLETDERHWGHSKCTERCINWKWFLENNWKSTSWWNKSNWSWRHLLCTQ